MHSIGPTVMLPLTNGTIFSRENVIYFLWIPFRMNKYRMNGVLVYIGNFPTELLFKNKVVKKINIISSMVNFNEKNCDFFLKTHFFAI